MTLSSPVDCVGMLQSVYGVICYHKPAVYPTTGLVNDLGMFNVRQRRHADCCLVICSVSILLELHTPLVELASAHVQLTLMYTGYVSCMLRCEQHGQSKHRSRVYWEDKRQDHTQCQQVQ